MELEATKLAGMTPAESRHLKALERRISAGLQTFREVGAALLEIRDQRLYRDTHSSFEAYCTERWGMNRTRAYQLIDSARVVQTLGEPEGLVNEAQARELAPLNPEDAQKVWTEVEHRASETGKPVTAPLIRQVKGEVIEPNGGSGPDQTPTDRLVQDITRLGNTYQRWKESKPNVGQRTRVNKAIKTFIQLVT